MGCRTERHSNGPELSRRTLAVKVREGLSHIDVLRVCACARVTSIRGNSFTYLHTPGPHTAAVACRDGELSQRPPLYVRWLACALPCALGGRHVR